jgi:hypothetical protein
MPEYLAPGVYVEETSFRSKSIEGVGTSTAGFAGPTRFGPISGHPELITSFGDFQRIYGGLEELDFGAGPVPNYLAHGVRAFFEEGGKRCYITRVFNYGDDLVTDDGGIPTQYYAQWPPRDGEDAQNPPPLRLVARFPGRAGNIRVTFTLKVGQQSALSFVKVGDALEPRLTRVLEGDVVHLSGSDLANDTGLYIVRGDGEATPFSLYATDDDIVEVSELAAPAAIHPLSLVIEIERPRGIEGFYPPEGLGEFSLNASRAGSLTQVFRRKPPIRRDALTSPFAIETQGTILDQVQALTGFAFTNEAPPAPVAPATAIRKRFDLEDGTDAKLPESDDYEGKATGFEDYAGDPVDVLKNGLLTFEALPDISIVAAPGYSAHTDLDQRIAIQNAVINHCERMRYRIAVLDTPPDFLPTEALGFRNRRSSKYAAIYYPWIVIADPNNGGRRLKLPPSGFVAGIYARNDNEHAVFKAPANEVVRLAIDFELILSKGQQELLNPEGVNCFRFFERRGFLLWGARTISDDPEWKYVNLRRYFAYLEYSIERGTQWAVFENNNEPLWANVRRTIEDFLYNEWRSGGLMGDKPEKAFFVRCDRSTMTQNDLDNGRLICLIGVAPVRPAEFVIFRIGQWTADTPA